jgi:hypothetical protein
VLPFSIERWIQAFASNSWSFAAGATLLVAMAGAGKRLESEIADRMLGIWKAQPAAGSVPRDWVYRLRNHPRYRAVVHATKHTVLPHAFGIALLALVVFAVFVGVSRVAFHAGTAIGLVCATAGPTTAVTVAVARDTFATRDRCWASGWALRAGETYAVRVDLKAPWRDGDIAVASPRGFGTGGMTWPMYAGLPLRRALAEPWFALTARIGTRGTEEYALAWEPGPVPGHFSARLAPRREGELFLFVNDAVIGLPFLTDLFYRNNEGTARVTVEPVRPDRLPSK